jgi:hypothetical protein
VAPPKPVYEPPKPVVPLKSEAEIKLETRLSGLSKEASKPLLDVFTKLKSGLTESLLLEFISLSKPTSNVSTIVSVSHVIAVREPGTSKSLNDVGSAI